MEYYIIYEIGDSAENGGRLIWPTIYTSYNVAVAHIKDKIDAAGLYDDGDEIGYMEKNYSKKETDNPDGVLVGNLYDYDVQYFIKKLKMS